MKSGYCLLLLLICKTYSYTLERFISDSVQTELKSASKKEREVHEDLDEDSKELIASGDKDYTMRDDVLDTSPTPTIHAVSVYKNGRNFDSSAFTKTLKAKVKRMKSNCSCEMHREYYNNHDDNGTHKREGNDADAIRATPTMNTMLHPTPTSNSIKEQLNESHLELKELEHQLDVAMKEVCPHYKDIPDLDINQMADVWQLAYYKSEDTLSCFKIYLKKVSTQSRKRYNIRYTSFNDTIDWSECHLELGSTGKRMNNRRHFLQGSSGDKGVLENIVLSQVTENENQVITLHDQTPDQWLVTKRLLLMRDCDSGDVVIFTRLPTDPDKLEFVEAMTAFGENGMNGTTPCIEQKNEKTKDVIKHGKYSILS